jgi:hypothetical protein
MDTFDLKARTKARSCWKALSPIAYTGIQSSIDETSLDEINRNLVQTMVGIVDDEYRIKEEQLLATIQLEYDKITAEQAIADARAVTQRTVFAMVAVTNAYVVSAERYVVAVKGLLMDAQEYALTIEQKRVAVGLLQAELAEEKAAIRIAEIDMKIELEALNRKFVEVDVLKAELNSSKADVKLVLAEIAIEEARLDEVEARVELAMTGVEEAKVMADIAMIFAEIATKQLTKRKYEVESAEIVAEFARIAAKLASILAILEIKQSQLSEQSRSQVELLGDVGELLVTKKDQLDTREEDAQNNLTVKDYEKAVIEAALAIEENLKERLLQTKIDHDDQRCSGSVSIDAAHLAAERIKKRYYSFTDSHTVSLVGSYAELARAISRS